MTRDASRFEQDIKKISLEIQEAMREEHDDDIIQIMISELRGIKKSRQDLIKERAMTRATQRSVARALAVIERMHTQKEINKIFSSAFSGFNQAALIKIIEKGEINMSNMKMFQEGLDKAILSSTESMTGETADDQKEENAKILAKFKAKVEKEKTQRRKHGGGLITDQTGSTLNVADITGAGLVFNDDDDDEEEQLMERLNSLAT